MSNNSIFLDPFRSDLSLFSHHRFSFLLYADKNVVAVGMVLMMYDHALTFADEVHLVWSARPSFAKRLFLLNRYVVLLSLVYAAVCELSHPIFFSTSMKGVNTDLTFFLSFDSRRNGK